MLKTIKNTSFDLNIQKINYTIFCTLLQEIIQDNSDAVPIYSIEVKMMCENTLCDNCFSGGFTSDKNFALKIFDLITVNQITPCSLCDIIDDEMGIKENI